jgi:DtxR family Mn-dependent transcriptional regulator
MTVKVSEKLSASLEDYLEAIYHLTAGQGVGRSKDIAEAMGVSRASVTGALKTLSEKALVHYQPYGYATLTEKGQQIARQVVRRHEVLTRFFEDLLGAKASTAQAAACRAEHTLGPEITARLMAFIEFVSETRDDGQDIAKQFQQYWEGLSS